MLIELKRCNSIGSIEGIRFLASILVEKDWLTRMEVVNRCSLEKNITVNCSGAIAFLNYLGYVEINNDLLLCTEKMHSLDKTTLESIIDCFVKESITKLIEEGVFDYENFTFNLERGRLDIKKSSIPLSYAAIRNFMIEAGVFELLEDGNMCVTETYGKIFANQVRSRKRKISLEQLRIKQEQQSKQGLEAEEFVLMLEKKRLFEKATKINRISDFDVAAGYDIVSFKTKDSERYDYFIEVKSYSGEKQFYWSENEVDVARIKGNEYILCLVDYVRMKEANYKPEYIINPYNVIFKDESWLVNSASYRIQKV